MRSTYRRITFWMVQTSWYSLCHNGAVDAGPIVRTLGHVYIAAQRARQTYSRAHQRRSAHSRNGRGSLLTRSSRCLDPHRSRYGPIDRRCKGQRSQEVYATRTDRYSGGPTNTLTTVYEGPYIPNNVGAGVTNIVSADADLRIKQVTASRQRTQVRR